MAQGMQGVTGAKRLWSLAALPWGLAALPMLAQGVSLPATDPVGIARSGVQVAYGYSLEAASLNPALLASLRESKGFFLSAGLEMQSSQVSLESNQRTWYSTDRNRSLAAFGAAYRRSPALTLGLKFDTPFQRHGQFALDAANRFLGDGIDLSARRLEAQAAWSLSPAFSLGLGLGVARLSYGSGTVLRAGIPLDPSQPASATNPMDGLLEQGVSQTGAKTVPSYSLGARWAVNPRWTLGFAYQSGYKADLALSAGFQGGLLGVYNNAGQPLANLGTTARAATLAGLMTPVAGGGRLELPARTSLGVRHRLNSLITWEADLRWTAAGLTVPDFAQLQTPSGPVAGPAALPRELGHLGMGLSAEVALGKRWTLRAGAFFDRNSVEEAQAEPLLGGARQATFSAGAGCRIWGGEVNLGYQYRQSKDQDVRNLDGTWSVGGFQATGTRTRVEGMGHLFAIGYKRTF